jgi:hypothetical protein
VRTREKKENRPDSQRRRKKKPLQKKGDSSKGLKGGRRYIKTD